MRAKHSDGQRRRARGVIGAVVPILIAALALAPVPPVLAARRGEPGRYHIGVYYFPGWKDDQLGGPRAKPWEPFAAYPALEPLLGWYQEGDPALLERQLGWMADSGISYVVFDQQFQRDGPPLLGQVINAYLALPEAARHHVAFAVLWTNHSKVPEAAEQFYAMVRYWSRTYMHDPDYVRVNGRPQLFVFSRWFLQQNATKFGMPVKDLFDRAQRIAHEEGLPGIDFVAGTMDPKTEPPLARDEGYAGFSSYGYHKDAAGHDSHSYVEMDADHRGAWEAIAGDAGGLRMVVPMTAGWDRRPWGGSPDPLHDQSRSTPEEFLAHLRAARRFMDDHYALTGGYGVICCWNEFGEGSYIEPTRGDGFDHLKMVGRVFGRDSVPHGR